MARGPLATYDNNPVTLGEELLGFELLKLQGPVQKCKKLFHLVAFVIRAHPPQYVLGSWNLKFNIECQRVDDSRDSTSSEIGKKTA